MNSFRGVLSTREVPNSPPPRDPAVLHYKPEYDTYTLVLQIILSLVIFLASSLYCLHTFHRKRDQPTENKGTGTVDSETDEKDLSERDATESNPKATDDVVGVTALPAIGNEPDEIRKTDEKLWQKYDELINSEDMPWQMIDIKVPAGSKYPKHLFEGDGTPDSSEEDAEMGDNTEAREKAGRDESAVKENIVQQSIPSEIGPVALINPVGGHLERKRSSASLHSDASSKGSSRNPSPYRSGSTSRPSSANRKPFVKYCGANQHSNTSLRRLSPVAASRRGFLLPPNQCAAAAVSDKNTLKNVRAKSPEKSATSAVRARVPSGGSKK